MRCWCCWFQRLQKSIQVSEWHNVFQPKEEKPGQCRVFFWGKDTSVSSFPVHPSDSPLQRQAEIHLNYAAGLSCPLPCACSSSESVSSGLILQPFCCLNHQNKGKLRDGLLRMLKAPNLIQQTERHQPAVFCKNKSGGFHSKCEARTFRTNWGFNCNANERAFWLSCWVSWPKLSWLCKNKAARLLSRWWCWAEKQISFRGFFPLPSTCNITSQRDF